MKLLSWKFNSLSLSMFMESSRADLIVFILLVAPQPTQYSIVNNEVNVYDSILNIVVDTEPYQMLRANGTDSLDAITYRVYKNQKI